MKAAQAPRLSILLDRVRQEEAQLHGAKKDTLLDMAEYVLGKRDYSKEEYNQAVAMLAKYRLWRLIDKRRPIHCRQLIQVERAKSYNYRCGRCGLPISSEKSLTTGLGRVCRGKVKDSTLNKGGENRG